jgi:hypothetical protein
MRIPKWLLMTLSAISVAALIAVFAGFWIYMPTETANRFIGATDLRDARAVNELLRNGKVEISNTDDYVRLYLAPGLYLDLKPDPVLVPRSASEVLIGQQRIAIHWRDEDALFVLTASWSKVQFGPIKTYPDSMVDDY